MDKEATTTNFYGLVYDFPSQKKTIDEYCIPVCKKIVLGIFRDDDLGSVRVCSTPAKDCPMFDNEMGEVYGQVYGEPIIIRKLKEIE